MSRRSVRGRVGCETGASLVPAVEASNTRDVTGDEKTQHLDLTARTVVFVVPNSPGRTVCGVADYAASLRDHVCPQASIVGYDVDENWLDRVRRLRSVLRPAEPEVVVLHHVHFRYARIPLPVFPLAVSLYCGLRKVPLFTIWHEGMSSGSRRLSWFQQIANRSVARRSCISFAAEPRWCTQLEALGAHSVVRLPIPSSIEGGRRVSPPCESRSGVVLFGQFHSGDRFDLARLRIVAEQLIGEGPELQLSIVGPGWPAGLEAHGAKTLGPLDEVAVADRLGTSLAAFLPLAKAVTEKSASMATLLSFGLPIVLTGPGADETVRRFTSKGIVRAPDEQSAVKTLAQLHQDPQFWLECSTANLRYYDQNLSWARLVALMERAMHLSGCLE
jgi:glycosyltransferase involved in cell wall biosynthesis